MREERSDAAPMDQAAGIASQTVQAQRAVNHAVQMQKSAKVIIIKLGSHPYHA